MMTSPAHSLEEFNLEPTTKTNTLRAPKIRRNPSWPAVVPQNSSSSSEGEDNRSKRNNNSKKQFLTSKVKKLHKRRLKARSRSQAESSLSVNNPMTDNYLFSSKKGWFQSSSRSSSTESFLSTNDDENTVISQTMPKRQHISSQSLFEANSETFNVNNSDSGESLVTDRHKKFIASKSDTALNKTNQPIHKY